MFAVGILRFVIVCHRMIAEVRRERAADAVHVSGMPAGGQRFGVLAAAWRQAAQAPRRLGLAQHLQAGDARPRWRPGCRPSCRLDRRAERRDLLHDVLAAAVSADRQAAADDFAERRQIGLDGGVIAGMRA